MVEPVASGVLVCSGGTGSQRPFNLYILLLHQLHLFQETPGLCLLLIL